MRTAFTAEQFTPTEWDSAEQKAKFANQFVRFVESDFKPTLFPKWFYTRLSMTFGHIAHFNIGGFYETFFTTTTDKLSFLKQTIQGGGYGDPTFTYCDVENVLAAWVKDSDLIIKLMHQASDETERSERGELARLQAKYQ